MKGHRQHWAKKQYNKSQPICSGPVESSDEGGCDIFLPVDWQIQSPFCSPVGGQRGGTCSHTQSVSDYTISLFHSPHPACQATWKGQREPPQRAQDGLTFRLPGIKIKKAQRTKEWPPLVLECMCVAGVPPFPSLLQICLLASTLREWWPCMSTDHLSCQVQVTQNIFYWPLYSDWMGTAGEQSVFPVSSRVTSLSILRVWAGLMNDKPFSIILRVCVCCPDVSIFFLGYSCNRIICCLFFYLFIFRNEEKKKVLLDFLRKHEWTDKGAIPQYQDPASSTPKP